MRKEIKTTSETTTQTKITYVAFDGTEFDNERECAEHEFNKRKAAFLHRDDIEVNYEAGPPCNGGLYYSDENEYIWVKPNTTSAWIDMNETFNSCFCFHSKDTGVCKWTCLEFNDYESQPATNSLDDTTKAIQEQFAKLGYDVSFQKKA